MISSEQISQMLVELEVAKVNLTSAIENKEKASNRVVDARNVYNGIAKRIDQAICELRNGAPSGTNCEEKRTVSVGDPS